mmetsp:Transcript_26111/g.39908  ORF Transcript_26111/g.39908 Transcript_26111/m.39908 type:complete len:107 (+) Transcript_26111:461-781(+)
MLNILGVQNKKKQEEEEGPYCAMHKEFHECHKIILSTERLLKREAMDDLKNNYVDVLYTRKDDAKPRTNGRNGGRFRNNNIRSTTFRTFDGLKEDEDHLAQHKSLP